MILVLTLQLADAATADKTYDVAVPSGEWRLESATFIPDSDGAAVTDAAEYRTITVKQGSTALAACTTNSSGGAAFVANTATAMTVSGGKDREFTGGTDTIKVASIHTGSTSKVAKGVVCLVIKKMQATAYPS